MHAPCFKGSGGLKKSSDVYAVEDAASAVPALAIAQATLAVELHKSLAPRMTTKISNLAKTSHCEPRMHDH